MLKKYRDKKIEVGECLDCEQPAEPKKKRCKKHLEHQRLQKEKSRAAKPGGQCHDCQETVVTGHDRCEKCLAVQAKASHKLYLKRKKLGVCTACGGEKDNEFVECDACKANLEDRRIR